MRDKVGIGILSFAHGNANVYCQVMKNFGDVTLLSAWDDNADRGKAVALHMIHKRDKAWTKFDFSSPMSHGERLKAGPRPLIVCVRGNKETTISAEEGRVSVEWFLSAYRSAAEGRRILLPF